MARKKQTVQVKTAEQIEAERLFEARLNQMVPLAREIVRTNGPKLIGVDKPNHWVREEQEVEGYRNMLEVALFLLVEGCDPEDVRAFLGGGDVALKMLAGFWSALWVSGNATPAHLAVAQTAHSGDLSPLVRIGWLDQHQIPDVLGSDRDDRHTRDRRLRAREKLAKFHQSIN